MPRIPRSTTIRVFGDEVDTWPRFCTNSGNCVQCVVEGKIPCAPRWHMKVKPEIRLGFVRRICQYCGAEFPCRESIANRGGGLYCSHECANKATIAKRTENRKASPRLPPILLKTI